MTQQSTADFYNEFLKSRMLGYRLNGGNLRIQMANDFIQSYLNPDDKILEIGCGIGIITEKISWKLRSGYIWACDISDQNIWYSKKTIKSKKINFFISDVITDFKKIKEKINKPVDKIIAVDVIEHIPLEKHLQFFMELQSISNKNTKIFLTFPSKYYQEYLKDINPSELQIIDETITLEHLINISNQTGMNIQSYNLKDVWMKNQYVHCILSFDNNVQLIPENNISIFKRGILKLLYIYRKRKYITRIFNAKFISK